MRFRRLDVGTDRDFAILAQVHRRNVAGLPDLLLGMLRDLSGDEGNYWMLARHPVFQVYFYGRHVGADPDERYAFADSPHFDRTAEFCVPYDERSFDPDYANEPTATFEPTVRQVLHKEWLPPA